MPKASPRFSRTRLKPTAKKPDLKLRMDGFKGGISDTLARMTPEELLKQILDLLELTDDDIKAFTPFPDENDPGIFESGPHLDDEVRTHVQVGDSQCLLTGHLKRRLEHISGFPRPLKETGDKAYRISTSLHRGLGMFAARQFKTGDLVADERPLMTLARIEQEELHASAVYRQTLRELFSAYLYLHDEKTALMYGEKLWLARLAAGEPLYEVFRNAEAIKVTAVDNWEIGESDGIAGAPYVQIRFILIEL
ncbi:hypothetical protein ARMSODRAFT_973197 [Armillaria solidipes]|uniref:Uncharacterized protein n=1 Tax=Armillaria solidipes TaxID=1076256 RepID=A0A2H3BZS1_9AGAR|nr:hypothetical protein ARMSODRAFT_973197 [Armillaria solidipes]